MSTTLSIAQPSYYGKNANEQRGQPIVSGETIMTNGDRIRKLHSTNLAYQDFLPVCNTGSKCDKKGNEHFTMNIGNCYDEYITKQLNYFVPKHKSYLKQSDINPQNKSLENKNSQKNVQNQKSALNYLNN